MLRKANGRDLSALVLLSEPSENDGLRLLVPCRWVSLEPRAEPGVTSVRGAAADWPAGPACRPVSADDIG